ncbi:MAG: hypothetical protein J6K23_02230 [Bacilli bacterium]|nr:hypothetical protein [Bacilli bacterium]
MEKEKEFKNWEYIVLIIMLCVIIALLSIVLYKAINKKKANNINEDNIVSSTKINEKLYKTFNRKDYDTFKNIKDNYVVRDMKIVQSDNSFTSIKLNDNEIGIRYVIYQEENEDKENNVYYSYYLELYFNNTKLSKVIKINDTKETYSELGSIKLDNIYFNKIKGLDNKEYLVIDTNINANDYSTSRHYVYTLNDDFKIIYEVPFVIGQELTLTEDYDLSFNNKLNISSDSIYYLSYKKKNKIDVHRVTIYDNKYYDETIDTKSGKKS